MSAGFAGPDSGYDFGRKRNYRRMVWGPIGREMNGDVALMPSLEGTEIEEAEKRGFPRHRIHVVDRNPAIVATLQKRYPGIQTYGVEVVRALERMKKKGVVLSAANWDLTSPVGDATIGVCSATGEVAEPGSLIAVTVLRGREGRRWFYFVSELGKSLGSWWTSTVERAWSGSGRSFSETDLGRLAAIKCFLNWDAELVRASSYRSEAGTQTMLWSLWRYNASNYWSTEACRYYRQAGRILEGLSPGISKGDLSKTWRSGSGIWRRAFGPQSRAQRAVRAAKVVGYRMKGIYE